MDTSALSRAGLDRLHDAMAARVAKGELPGLVTLLARGDEVHVDAIGTMAFGGAEPMPPDAIFRIASMTKPIIAGVTRAPAGRCHVHQVFVGLEFTVGPHQPRCVFEVLSTEGAGRERRSDVRAAKQVGVSSYAVPAGPACQDRLGGDWAVRGRMKVRS